LAFLDADDLWAPEKLKLQMAEFEKNPSVGLVHTGVKIIDAQGQELKEYKNKHKSKIDSFMDLFHKNQIATSSVLISKSCISEAGVFDEDKSIISLEDYDLWLRIADKFKIVLINKPLLFYRLHHQGISRNIERSYAAEEKVILKNMHRFEHNYPSLKQILPDRLSQIYFECGSDYFYNNQIKEAKTQFKKSLRQRPFNFKIFMWYCLMYLGPEQIKNLKSFKKKILS
jgi:hypothetical protein